MPLAVVRGVGLVTPLGWGEGAWRALCEGKFLTDCGRVREALPPGSSRVGALAWRAARLACANGAGRDLGGPDTALVVGTSKGPIDAWLEHLEGGTPHPAGLADLACGLGDVAREVGDALGIVGPRLTVSAACASGLEALIRATLLVRAGEVRRALVVAAESSLHPLFAGSFRRLGVLSPAGAGCRPFDRQRRGFFMSEAAAAVLLEAAEPEEFNPEAPARNDGPAGSEIIAVERFAMGGDAVHLTGGDAEGRVLCELLARVIDGRPVDLVHAHGTGTLVNDETELAALEQVLGGQDRPPSLYSHKGAIGHTLGAAGLVSIAINCMCHWDGVVPPNVRSDDPLPSRQVTISPGAVRRPVRRSLASAAGFGGPVAVVSLVSCDGL